MKFPAAAFTLASGAILQNSVMALADHIYWRTAGERTSSEHHFERQVGIKLMQRKQIFAK